MSLAMDHLRRAIAAAGPDYWLRDARVPASLLAGPVPAATEAEGLVRLDLRIAAGRIAALAPAGTGPEGPSLDGGQLWPGFVDGHTHLDKGQIWPRSPNRSGDFRGALAAAAADRDGWTEADIEARFDFSLRAAHAHGTVAIRTHLESFGPSSWRVFRRLREAWAGRITLQASSIRPLEDFADEAGTELADLVAASGGALGTVTRLSGGAGAPLPEGFQALLDRCFALAEERGLDLDLHVDESGEAGARALREIALTALRRRFPGRIQAGHCCALAMQPESEARETIRLCAEAGLAVVVLPMCNLYLQDRVAGRTPRWRGVTLVHEMRAAGIPVSVASDNARDPFFAYGDLDMVEVYREATRILHLDHPVADWPRAATVTPAGVMRLPEAGWLCPGAPADLVLFRARGWSEFLARPQADRIVLRGGRVLAAEPPDWRELDALLG
ncbi:cytosine deaminase [Paeniroseomonas aquatica]|uniref:Cytosine deaminase n=1 Tax=Paeniroseomonas aquatica TaxID=373043 RepID=A0ABT8AE96_9PROT|nr:cytosine deaminase [Paeniroseomonas aquatica]MDN3568133.1 cytosine deaminase [Paeniroseomonas aquatica]